MKLDKNKLYLMRIINIILILVFVFSIIIGYQHPMFSFGRKLYHTIGYSAMGIVGLLCLVTPKYFASILSRKENDQPFYSQYRLLGCIWLLLVIGRIAHFWS